MIKAGIMKINNFNNMTDYQQNLVRDYQNTIKQAKQASIKGSCNFEYLFNEANRLARLLNDQGIKLY